MYIHAAATRAGPAHLQRGAASRAAPLPLRSTPSQSVSKSVSHAQQTKRKVTESSVMSSWPVALSACVAAVTSAGSALGVDLTPGLDSDC